jgi:hypothetical protein
MRAVPEDRLRIQHTLKRLAARGPSPWPVLSVYVNTRPVGSAMTTYRPFLKKRLTEELKAFAERTQIPVAHTLLGVGAIDERHPLSYGFMGMHGWKHVNRAIQSADLLIALGMRFDDRVTGNVSTYAPNARIVHVDIDPSEIGKNVAVDVPIVGDVGRVLRALTPQMRERTADEREPYFSQLAEWRASWGLSAGPVAAIPLSDVAPHVVVITPVTPFDAQMREVHRRAVVRSEG